jgi:UDP-N-acetylmuramoyl-tripeptide--D-alanyl-D-alanine ligase
MDIISLYQAFKESSQISTDSRKIEKGSIFFALKGDNFNGNLYAKGALEKGASYVVVDQIIEGLPAEQSFKVDDVLTALQQLANHHRKVLKIPIIGITGSNGKTTTKELLATVLNKKYNTYFTKGNLNNHIGVPLSLLSITEKHELAIIEMGANHVGEIADLCNICEPNYGLITNIGKAHLEGFGGVQGIIKGKGELYDFIQKKNGQLFLNADSRVLKEMAKERGLIGISYGQNSQANLEGSLESSNPFISFIWNWSYKGVATKSEHPITSQLFGSYNYDNLLAAVCVGNFFEVVEQDINDALSSYQSEMNRSQIIEKGSNSIYLDAYNANPTSMQAAIESFDQLVLKKSKVAIIGDMFELGEDSSKEHLSILELLKKVKLDTIILVGKHFHEHQNTFPGFNFYETRQNLEEEKEQLQIGKSAVLIKGSRGVALEKLLDFIS